MLMMAQPIVDAIKAVCEKRGVPCKSNIESEASKEQTKVSCENAEESGLFFDRMGNNAENAADPGPNSPTRSCKRIYLSPRGVPLTQALARELSQEDELILLCGHYEGVDQRVLDKYIDMEVSIGDYVLTGGELGAMVLADCVARLIPGVLGSAESPEDESFSDAGLLEYPQYTRPREFEGMVVPEVLLNGDHAKINAWRREQAILVTQQRRPELLQKANLTDKERKILKK